MTRSKPAAATDPLRSGVVVLPRRGPVTALRVMGTGVEHDITRHPRHFTIGRTARAGDPPSRADIQLPSLHVSWQHARVERRNRRLYYRDRKSCNGSYIGRDREPTFEFEIKAGMVFRVADVSLIGMSRPLRALRDRLSWCVGLDAHARVDRALVLAARDAAVALVGPPGCEQEPLARAIHAASTRWKHPFLSLTPATATLDRLRAARFATVFLDIGSESVKDLPAAFVRHLFGIDGQLQQRPIVAGRSPAMTRRLFAGLVEHELPFIDVPDLASRADEVPRLLDALLAEAGCPHRTRELGAEPVARLRQRDWQRNLESLRAIVPTLVAVLSHDRRSDAALAAGVTPQAISNFIRRLFRGDD